MPFTDEQHNQLLQSKIDGTEHGIAEMNMELEATRAEAAVASEDEKQGYDDRIAQMESDLAKREARLKSFKSQMKSSSKS